ncbi:hypothetical protein [Aureispira anguillae]|uniref:EGF-like domain-containing protein n=1 Tax=Aureispira anguillae TaxID=2864201 RepID=A0A916DQ91_9BACT|nr:hypothetical protein [Aureispira anguillae]BDS11034.1 hypothetical protein AsAng_0017450 [Aureispira anguillae]
MKNLINLFLGALLVISCNTDPCKDVVCGTAGTCTEGICVCDAGYEQDAAGLCNTEMRTKFIGSWVVSDSCTASVPASYTVSAINGTGIMDFNVTNFWNIFSNSVTATVSASSEFSIARQEPDNDDFFVESVGNATLTGNTISMTYIVSDETDPANISRDTCYSTWVKQ